MTVRVAVPIEIDESNLEASGISEPDTIYGEQAWMNEASKTLEYNLFAPSDYEMIYSMTRNNYGEMLVVARNSSGNWAIAKFSSNNSLTWSQVFDTSTGLNNNDLICYGCGVKDNTMLLYWFVDNPLIPEFKRVYEQRITNIAREGSLPLSYTSAAAHLSSFPSSITDNADVKLTRSGSLIFAVYSNNNSGFLSDVKVSRISLAGDLQLTVSTNFSTGSASSIASDGNGGIFIAMDGDYGDGRLTIQNYDSNLTKTELGKVNFGYGTPSQLGHYSGVISIGGRLADIPFNQLPVTPYSTTLVNYGSYKLNDEVVYLPNHTKYVCIVKETFSNPLETATGDENAEWLRIGLSNRWAMFDGSVSYASLFGGNKSVTINPGSDYDTVGCVGVDGMSFIRLDVLDQFGGLLYREDKPATNPDSDFLDFSLSEIVFTDIPPFVNAKVKVSFFVDGSGESRVGEFIVAKSYDIGTAVTGTQSNTKDFSEQKEDQFGNFEYIERAIVPSVTYQVDVKKGKAIAVQRFVNSIRGKSNLWYADIGEPEFLTVYGRCETIPMTYENHSIVSYKAKVRGTI